MKFLASFALFLIVLYGVYYYIQRFGYSLQPSGKEIKILEMKMIGKNRLIILLKVRSSLFLLASDEQGIKILKEWEESA